MNLIQKGLYPVQVFALYIILRVYWLLAGKYKFRKIITLESSKLQSDFDEFVKWSVKKMTLIGINIPNYKKYTILRFT